jgi:hypothetical protein
MTIADDVKTVMKANATLMAVLTGDVWVGITEINRQTAAAAFDANGEIKPCALIKVGTEVPSGPYSRSTQVAIMIYFYQRTGYGFIESAMDKTYDLLHEKKIGTGTFLILHNNTLHGYEVVQREPNALGAMMAMQRYYQTKLR